MTRAKDISKVVSDANFGGTLDVTGDVDIDGTTNLDAVDIDGAVQIDAAFTSGVDGQGYDTKFFGDTASAFMLWDTSADDLILSGVAALSVDNTTDSSSTTTGSIHTDGGVGIAGKLFVGTDLDVNGTANLDAVDIDGAVPDTVILVAFNAPPLVTKKGAVALLANVLPAQNRTSSSLDATEDKPIVLAASFR